MTQTNKIFHRWSRGNTDAFLQGTVVAEHTLSKSALFSDESLIELLEKHPDTLSMVYAMPINDKSEATFREGDLRGLDGAAILEAVSKGELWVQLLKLNDTHPEFAALKDQILREMGENIPGFRSFKCHLSLLISSPTINVSYHADLPRNALWQIRGSKRVYLYPATAPYISQETLEAIYLGQQQEAIDYSPEFDDGAKIVELHPGMVATWPVNGPHRIENMGELSVSMVMEYFQPHAFIRFGEMYANGIFRRHFDFEGKPARNTGMAAFLKSILGFAFKGLKLSRAIKRPRYLEFEVDAQSSGGYRKIEPRLRDF